MEKVYALIGATSDIGMKYIKEIDNSNEKSTIIAIYLHENERFKNLINELKNVKIDLVECDLSKNDDVQNTINYIKEKYNAPTNVLHLAARKYEYVKFTKFNWEDVLTDLEIQVHSFAEFMKAFLPEMSKQKYGKVVVMLSSVTKGVPPKYVSEYTLVKYALQGLVYSLVSEYKEKNININCISPTMVETNFLEKIDSRIIEMTAINSSMKRNVKIEEVVSAIKYLMSDDADYINGLNLPLTGGDIV